MDPYFHTFHSWDDHPLNICLPGLLQLPCFFGLKTRVSSSADSGFAVREAWLSSAVQGRPAMLLNSSDEVQLVQQIREFHGRLMVLFLRGKHR